jgi:hypothetical protein
MKHLLSPLVILTMIHAASAATPSFPDFDRRAPARAKRASSITAAAPNSCLHRRQYTVEDVQVLSDATVTINRRAGGYTVEAAVPLKTLGFDPQPGKSYKLDLGVIFSDGTGTTRALRMYWVEQGHRPGQRRPRRNHADAQAVGDGAWRRRRHREIPSSNSS